MIENEVKVYINVRQNRETAFLKKTPPDKREKINYKAFRIAKGGEEEAEACSKSRWPVCED